MIQEITSYFDVVFAMPIEAQCHFAIGLSFVGFVFAAFIRETCKQSLVRYGARIIGAASFFAVAAFANHVSHEYEKLNLELMVRKGKHDAKEIADQTRTVALAAEYVATTKSGTQFKINRYDDGRTGPVSALRRCDRVNIDTNGDCAEPASIARRIAGGSVRRTGVVPTGEHGRRF